MTEHRKAELYLLLVTAIWGLTFPLIGAAVKLINPVDFVTLRFTLASMIMLPFVWWEIKYTDAATLKYGLLLGVLDLGVYSLQCFGLSKINAGESAFITAISVILVPFLIPLFKSQKLKFMDWARSGICLLGLYILTGAHLVGLNRGELATLLVAVLVALTIIITKMATYKTSRFTLLVFYQIVFVMLGAWPLSLSRGIHITINQQIIFSVLFCAIFATVAVLYMQIKYQKFVSAPKAALIFSAEPLFACIFAWMLYGENITMSMIMGGTLIVLSMVLPDFSKAPESVYSDKIT